RHRRGRRSVVGKRDTATVSTRPADDKPEKARPASSRKTAGSARPEKYLPHECNASLFGRRQDIRADGNWKPLSAARGSLALTASSGARRPQAHQAVGGSA